MEGGGDMTMATWGGSTVQSVDDDEDSDTEEGYYEGDTIQEQQQQTGDSAAVVQSDHDTYTVDAVPFRVDRHTPRRRVLTPDSSRVHNAGKKIKLENQPRTGATDFPASQTAPNWPRPSSPVHKYRHPDVELQEQLATSTNMCTDLIRSQLQLVDVLTYRLNTQPSIPALGLEQYYDTYHQQLAQYHHTLHDYYQNIQQTLSQQQQQQSSSEHPLHAASNVAAGERGSGFADPQPGSVPGAGGYSFGADSSSSLFANPSNTGQFPIGFAAAGGVQNTNSSSSAAAFTGGQQHQQPQFTLPPPPNMSPFQPFGSQFAPAYTSPFFARGVTPQHSYPWSPLRPYTSPMRPLYDMPPPSFRASPTFHVGHSSAPYAAAAATNMPQPVPGHASNLFPPSVSPSGVTALSGQAVAPSTPSARSASTLLHQQQPSDPGLVLGSAPISSSTGRPAVSFGVPTVANMSQKSMEDSVTFATTFQPMPTTGLGPPMDPADSESSMPCSLPDDVANRYSHVDALGAGTASDQNVSEEFSLFEALRDSIYSEVATLISNNEARPHFLIELFRELQLLRTDYLRQRALYSIQDLVTRFLTEESLQNEANALSNSYMHWSGADQTPSDSLVTSDDDTHKERPPVIPGQTSHDYSELAESTTTLSTPPVEPFASDSLGDTVIHLDTKKAFDEAGHPLASNGDTSDSSKSDGAFSVDHLSTQALDQHIKTIMIEVIPLLKNQLQSPCSAEFLASIQQFVMQLALRTEDQQLEYVQIFTTQLDTTLSHSLAKYRGKLLKDCGEELLIDISEVLFNEMAFLKLMEDVANHPDTEMLGVPLAHVVESKSPDKMATATGDAAVGLLQSLASSAMKQLQFEEEELGKDRDDDLAEKCDFPLENQVSSEGQAPTTEPQISAASDGTGDPPLDTSESSNELTVEGSHDTSDVTKELVTDDISSVDHVIPTIVDQGILEAKLDQEQKSTTGLAGVLATLPPDTALAGVGEAIKEPTDTEP